MSVSLLQTSSSTFWVFNWYYLTAVLLSLTGVIFGIKNYFKNNKSKDKAQNEAAPKIETQIIPLINPVINPINNINVNLGKNEYLNLKSEIPNNENPMNRDAIIESLKSKVHILFIDDDKKFNIVKILKDSKWKNTNTVADIKSVDLQIIKDADIIFVDINGVGKLLECEHEGLDIALMLKRKYPIKKIVIYSANKNNNNFHPAWDECDFKLEKNALSYQYLSLVEQYSIELYS
jgi:hypothetical protein